MNVTVIPPKPEYTRQAAHRQLNAAGYARVSTDKEEQESSFEAQRDYYTDKIMSNPEWRFVGIFADEGITGTQTKNRDGFNRMIRQCKRGKIDLVLTKSISRFARNTVDSLNTVRMLKSLGIGVIFEKEGIDTRSVTNEFLLTIYASLAQAESESLSGNVKWGKQQSAKAGKVAISYKSFLGYRRGSDDKPEIVPDEAKIVRRIYSDFLAGQSRKQIADALTVSNIPTPMGKSVWSASTIASILRQEKYKGCALLQKTFVSDCIAHTVEVNAGQLPQYFVENSHTAIVDKGTWNRAQEELARRGSKRKVKQTGTKTEQGKYSSKYALTELLVCGDCGTPYRRVTWTRKGEKKIVWRCISRLDYGSKYCKKSPTLEESMIQNAIVNALMELTTHNLALSEMLKLHIVSGLRGDGDGEGEYALRQRLLVIDSEVSELIQLEYQDGDQGNYDVQFEKLCSEKAAIKAKLDQIRTDERHEENEQTRLTNVIAEMNKLRHHPIDFDDVIVRQMVECVRVLSKERLLVCFRLGGEMEVAMA
jgi:DNA invertase Pin-like site-specific DNA recombinase